MYQEMLRDQDGHHPLQLMRASLNLVRCGSSIFRAGSPGLASGIGRRERT